ncbi:MAG: hypothetical protein G01um101429_175 [Parcubacteria group bacterium Gr01-1014_29]|nr:MAG: hypothetical protein G01um101429_175 [Parcubacteria group bacterium Gr01-1014_29]
MYTIPIDFFEELRNWIPNRVVDEKLAVDFFVNKI